MPTPLQTPKPCVQAGCVLPGTTGPDRVNAFLTSKKKLVLDTAAGGSASTSIPLSLDKFVYLLGSFDPAVYNGVRVYFVCYPDSPVANSPAPPNQQGQLGLLFVPTLAVPELATGVDDPTRFYHFYNDDLVPMDAPGSVPTAPLDYVTTWIGHYRKDRINLLEQDGKGTNPDFRETNSLWYSMLSIAGGPKETGLLKFIACGRAYTPNPIIGLSAEFSAFLPTDGSKFPNYQLSTLYSTCNKRTTRRNCCYHSVRGTPVSSKWFPPTPVYPVHLPTIAQAAQYPPVPRSVHYICRRCRH